MNQYECFEHGQPLGYIEMELVRLTNIGAKSFDVIMGALVGPDPEQSNKVSEIHKIKPRNFLLYVKCLLK